MFISNVFFILMVLTAVVAFPISHPFYLSLLLAVFSALAAVGMWQSGMFWAFLSILLAFLGGVMALVLYMASLMNNEKPNSSQWPAIIFAPIVMCWLGVVPQSGGALSVGSLYLPGSGHTMVILTLYLLISLLAIVKVSSSHLGALKS